MERQIKGIFIPIEIWENKQLSWNEKILLMEIDSFTSKELPCYFSNEYIAELLGVKENTASIILSKLIKKGYVRKVGFNGRERFVESLLHYTCGDLFAGFDENQSLPLTEIKHNNTSIINKERKEYTKKSVEDKRAEFRKLCDEHISEYGKEMVDDFFEYWTETKLNGTTLRWEKEKTFEIGRRLKVWARNNFNRNYRQPVPQAKKKELWEVLGYSSKSEYESYVRSENAKNGF